MFIEPICNTTSILQLWVYYLSFNFLFIALLSVPSSVLGYCKWPYSVH